MLTLSLSALLLLALSTGGTLSTGSTLLLATGGALLLLALSTGGALLLLTLSTGSTLLLALNTGGALLLLTLLLLTLLLLTLLLLTLLLLTLLSTSLRVSSGSLSVTTYHTLVQVHLHIRARHTIGKVGHLTVSSSAGKGLGSSEGLLGSSLSKLASEAYCNEPLNLQVADQAASVRCSAHHPPHPSGHKHWASQPGSSTP